MQKINSTNPLDWSINPEEEAQQKDGFRISLLREGETWEAISELTKEPADSDEDIEKAINWFIEKINKFYPNNG